MLTRCKSAAVCQQMHKEERIASGNPTTVCFTKQGLLGASGSGELRVSCLPLVVRSHRRFYSILPFDWLCGFTTSSQKAKPSTLRSRLIQANRQGHNLNVLSVEHPPTYTRALPVSELFENELSRSFGVEATSNEKWGQQNPHDRSRGEYFGAKDYTNIKV